MPTTVTDRAYERIDALSRRGFDLVSFWRECTEVIRSAVPHIGSPCWVAEDPASLLITSHFQCGLPEIPSDWLAREFYEDDFNTFTGMARSSSTVATLHDATRGDLKRSARFRHTIEPTGADQELRAVLRTRAGEVWGALGMYREPGDPTFDQDELAFVEAIGPLIAEGIRKSLLLTEATESEGPDAPGLIVLTSDWTIDSMTPGVERWLAELPGERLAGDLPATVMAVAGQALRPSGGTGVPGEAAFARVLSRSGRWILVHGAALASDGTHRAAVIIEPAHPARIAPLLMSAYQLTERERDITRLVLRGKSTTEIAAALVVSVHTVQQHLKSIFDKTGVSSRRDLVGKIFFAHYEPRLRDNEQRSLDGKPHRAGPMDPDPRSSSR